MTLKTGIKNQMESNGKTSKSLKSTKSNRSKRSKKSKKSNKSSKSGYSQLSNKSNSDYKREVVIGEDKSELTKSQVREVLLFLIEDYEICKLFCKHRLKDLKDEKKAQGYERYLSGFVSLLSFPLCKSLVP